MRLISRVFCASICAVMLPAHIIGTDDRQYLNQANEAIFSGVGKIICGKQDAPQGSHSVTGTLIGNDVTVLTVGHYRTASSGQEFEPDECEFVNFDDDGSVRARRAIRAEAVARKQSDYSPYNTAVPDWAILRLAAPIEAGIAKPVDYRILDFGAVLKMEFSVLIAHHGIDSTPSSNRRIASPNCKIEQREARTRYFLHFCDTQQGASGGLFYQMGEDGKIFAFAINTAESNPSSEAPANFGQALNKAQDLAIRDLSW